MLCLCSAATSAAEPDLGKAREQILQQVNDFRGSQKLGPVEADAELQKVAEEFAKYMARTGRYGHNADGRTPTERAEAAGYDYCIVSENIAYRFNSAGFTSAELTDGFFEGWKDSPEHRHNMLDADVTQTGMAIAKGDGHTYYAVQMFGRPKSMQITFKLANRSGENVEYTLGGETFDLPPRYTRTHHVCRPPSVKLPWRQEPLKPADGEEYVVEAGDGGLTITRSSE